MKKIKAVDMRDTVMRSRVWTVCVRVMARTAETTATPAEMRNNSIMVHSFLSAFL
jgi:hypothetical protein